MSGRVSNDKDLLKNFVVKLQIFPFLGCFLYPVWYRELMAKTGEIKMLKGPFVRINWNVGDSLCMKTLTIRDNLKEHGQIISRGVVVPQTPGVPFYEHMFRNPNDCFSLVLLKITPPALEEWRSTNWHLKVTECCPVQRGPSYMLER